MFSAEDIAKIVAAVMKEIGQQKSGGYERLDERYFMRIDKFTGDEEIWK
jgi:hypothetical protein